MIVDGDGVIEDFFRQGQRLVQVPHLQRLVKRVRHQLIARKL